jgi:hypothetical protein
MWHRGKKRLAVSIMLAFAVCMPFADAVWLQDEGLADLVSKVFWWSLAACLSVTGLLWGAVHNMFKGVSEAAANLSDELHSRIPTIHEALDRLQTEIASNGLLALFAVVAHTAASIGLRIPAAAVPYPFAVAEHLPFAAARSLQLTAILVVFVALGVQVSAMPVIARHYRVIHGREYKGARAGTA